MAALHGLTRGTLRVGTFASASIQLLPAIMKEFMGLYPGIRFELLCCWEFAQVEDLIRRGQADCGFLGLPVGPDLETFPLFRDQLMAILPPDHPLSQAPFYPMARFAEDPFIRVPEDRDVEFGRIFQQAGVRPNLHYTVNDDFADPGHGGAGAGREHPARADPGKIPATVLRPSLWNSPTSGIWSWPCGGGAPPPSLPPALWTASAAGSARRIRRERNRSILILHLSANIV